jgi:hypothetical protein
LETSFASEVIARVGVFESVSSRVRGWGDKASFEGGPERATAPEKLSLFILSSCLIVI